MTERQKDKKTERQEYRKTKRQKQKDRKKHVFFYFSFFKN